MAEITDGLCYGTLDVTGVGANPDTANDADSAALVDSDVTFSFA